MLACPSPPPTIMEMPDELHTQVRARSMASRMETLVRPRPDISG
jgi:hypothetical protein